MKSSNQTGKSVMIRKFSLTTVTDTTRQHLRGYSAVLKGSNAENVLPCEYYLPDCVSVNDGDWSKVLFVDW